jgi:tetratricopeptide (TPR) repeat protein
VRRALQVYEKALNLVQHDTSFPDELKASSRELKKSCWLNLAACCLKLGKPAEAAKHCGKVLELEHGNSKALYRCVCAGGVQLRCGGCGGVGWSNLRALPPDGGLR